MTKYFILILIIFLMIGCAGKTPNHPTITDAIQTTDGWWESIKNENPNYYDEIDFLTVVIHLCGSRARLWAEFNKDHPKSPLNLSDNWYMLTVGGNPIHVWLVVKVVDDKIILHKWAVGHEMLRVLACYAKDIKFTDADEYQIIKR